MRSRAHGDMAGANRAWIVREALVLPLLFLTVAFGGGLRAGASGLVFLAPSLMALVLALALLGVQVRSGLLAVGAFLGPHRTPLEAANGAVTLTALFCANAQIFNGLTPERGLLNLAFNIFFLALLGNTLAADPDARRLLRSLFVVFGSAFVLKYVLLASMYDPQGGFARRVFTTLLDGVTLGGLGYAPHAPATGYVAFFVLVLYLFGLLLLPRRVEVTGLPAQLGVDRVVDR